MTGEFAAIKNLRQRLGEPRLPGETWIGDDAAVVMPATGNWLLLAADTVVAGIHADLALTGIDDLGWKAMAASLSDIAAMGAVAGHALVTVAGPAETDLMLLYEGLAAASEEYRCPIVGGDLTNSECLVVTVAVTGSCEGPPVLRAGARPGDGIWVTGPLGAAAAGLRVLRNEATVEPGLRAALVMAHARPRPLLEEGSAARSAGASAMIDVSDGLLADLGHICESSAVGFRLDDVPVAEGATRAEALGGGEDFALVFCLADTVAPDRAFPGTASPVRIGVCTEDPRERVLGGDTVDTHGWEHRW